MISTNFMICFGEHNFDIILQGQLSIKSGNL